MVHFKTQNINQMSFVEYAVKRHVQKNKFFNQLNDLIDWSPIEKELLKVYTKGQKERGTKAHHPLVLFKMQLISVWYNLSDVRTEEMVNDSLSFMHFCGLELEDIVPDHSTLSRFRSELTAKRAYDRLLRKINEQLKQKKLIIKEGKTSVDASLTASPFSPKGATTYSLASDRQEDERDEQDKLAEATYHNLKKVEQPGADNEARWLKKGKKTLYGYKKHIAVDENGIILGVHTTAANEHDSKGMISLVDKLSLDESRDILADKGYQSEENRKYIIEHSKQFGTDEHLPSKDKPRCRARLMLKKPNGKELSDRAKFYNKFISSFRWVVERTFGGLKLWFGSGVTRLKGTAKVHGLHVVEAIAYNLKRAPRIPVPNL